MKQLTPTLLALVVAASFAVAASNTAQQSSRAAGEIPVKFTIHSIRIEGDPIGLERYPALRPMAAGRENYLATYVTIGSAPPNSQLGYEYTITLSGVTVLHRTVAGFTPWRPRPAEPIRLETFRLYVPFKPSKAGTYRVTVRITLGGHIQVRNVSIKAVEPVFTLTMGLAADSRGNLYVADSDAARIIKLSSTGKVRARWGAKGSGAGQFISPIAVTVDPQGNLYVLDIERGDLQKLSPAGRLLARTSVGYQEPTSIALDSRGRVYLARFEKPMVVTFSSKLKVLRRWKIAESDKHLFSLAIGRNGTVYLANGERTAIHVYSPTGKLVARWSMSTRGLSAFVPGALATDEQGNVYAREEGATGMIKLSPEGRLLARWSAGEQISGGTAYRGIAVGPHGVVYVAGHDEIRKLSAQGRLLDIWL